MVSLCNSPNCPQTHFVDQTGLELTKRVLFLKTISCIPGCPRTHYTTEGDFELLLHFPLSPVILVF